MKALSGVVLFVLAQGLAGCGDSSRSSLPIAPTQVVPQPASQGAGQQPTGIMVNGYVSDGVFRPVAGAVVEVLDGPQAGLSATVGGGGEFTLAGNFDDTTRFRARREGYVDSIGTLSPRCATCAVAPRFVYLVLGIPAPPVEIAGEYNLTLVADGTCPGLPGELRTRTYSVTITPVSDSHYAPNTNFQAIVSGAQFLKGYETFAIGVAGDLVALDFRWEGPSFVEEVAPNTYIGFDGRAEASVGTSRVSTISAPFQGSVDYCALKAPMGQYFACNTGLVVAHAECESKNHQLILTRH